MGSEPGAFAVTEPYQLQLEQLIRMAKTPGFKEYAWSRAKELESCRTGMWQGISEDLKQAMLSSAAPRKSGG